MAVPMDDHGAAEELTEISVIETDPAAEKKAPARAVLASSYASDPHVTAAPGHAISVTGSESSSLPVLGVATNGSNEEAVENAPHVILSDSSAAPALAELATAAGAGDTAAQDALIREIYPPIRRYCWSRLGRLSGAPSTPEDVAQEVCMAVIAALPRYRDVGKPFEAFMYRIAANKAADVARNMSRIPTPTEHIDEAVTEHVEGAEVTVVHQLDVEQVRGLMNKLSPKYREILTLRIAMGFSAEKVGQALGMSPGATRVAQHRALQQLRKLAQSEGLVP